MVEFLNTAANPDVHLLLAHGAGAPMDSPFMNGFAHAAAARGISVHRFEFAYMAGRRSGGPKRPPPKLDLLEVEYRHAIAAWRSANIDAPPPLIGGKSMGGRVASLIADALYADSQIAGLVCLGYPFHPQGKPEQLRIAHLGGLRCPTLIVQGERDPFGNRDEVSRYRLSTAITICWVGDGDHDFGPRGRSGFTRKANIEAAAEATAAFAAVQSAI